MPNYVGSGPGGAIQAGVDRWTPVQGELVRQDLVDHEDGLADHETRIDTLEGSSGGDVDGPASSTDNEIPRFDGTTGKLLQASGVTIPDGASGSVNGVNTGDVTLAGTPDYITIAGQVVTRNPIDLTADVSGDLPLANLAQAPAASRLLGRGSAGGAGDWEAISLGTNLSFSGTTLNASGGGGGALDDLSDVAITTPATGQVLKYNGSAWVNGGVPGPRTVTFVIDGGGSVISTGAKDGFVRSPISGTITKVTTLSSDAAATSGSIVIDVWKDTYANYPPTNADSITASAPPTISSGIKSEDSTLTGWTTAVTAGDIFGITVDSVTSLKHVTLILEITP